MNLTFKKLKKNWKIFFCFALLLIGILFAFAIFVFKPQKINMDYIYDYNNKITTSEVKFPMVQHISFNQDNLKVLNIFLRDSSESINIYHVELLGNDDEMYFDSKFNVSDNSVISISLEKLNLVKNEDYILKINCDTCVDTEVSVKDSNNEKIYLEGQKDKTLEMMVHYASKNNSYFWYSALIIVIALTLLPIAKGDKGETL